MLTSLLLALIDDPTSKNDAECIIPEKLDGRMDPKGSTVQRVTDFDANAKVDAQLDNFPRLQQWPNMTSVLCTLSLCQKTYEAGLSGGHLRETLIGSSQVLRTDVSDSATNSYSLYIPFECNMDGMKYQLNDYVDVDYLKRMANYSNQYGDFNYDDLRIHSPNSSRLDLCRYEVENSILFTMGMEASDTFSGKGSFLNHNNENGESSESRFTQSKVNPWSHDQNVTWTSPLLASIYGDGNWSVMTMNQTLERISKALTVYLRTHDSRGSHAKGITFQTEQYVQANIYWLILPGILVLTTFVVLTMTMRKSRAKGDRMIWKSSQSALLFHGVPNDEEIGPLDSPKDIREASRKTRVKLSPAAGGWKLERTREPKVASGDQEILMDEPNAGHIDRLGTRGDSTNPPIRSTVSESSLNRCDPNHVKNSHFNETLH